MYNDIFFTNVRRLLDAKGMNRLELSRISGVANSYLATLSRGQANPSLRVMEAIANALETPLALLLESSDLSQEELNAIAGHKARKSLPPGFSWVTAILPDHKAFVVRKWAEEAQAELKKGKRRRRGVMSP